MSVEANAASRPAVILSFALILGLSIIGLAGQASRPSAAGAARDASPAAVEFAHEEAAVVPAVVPAGASASASVAAQTAGEARDKDAKPKATAAAKPAPSAPRLLTYTVKSGDTLTGIAHRYGISPRTIEGLNALTNPNALKVNQKLRILSVDGAVHTVRDGDTLWGISRRYSISVAKILAANPTVNADRLSVGTELVLPGVVPHRAVASSGGSSSGSSRSDSRQGGLSSRGGTLGFAWPVGGRITSSFGARWGSYHEGIDIAAAAGAEVRAAASGRVVYSGWYGGYGKLVIIDHGNGYRTRYGHNASIFVSEGETVSRGERIASVGSTGRATGPHLHFEVRRNGQAVNPLSFLR